MRTTGLPCAIGACAADSRLPRRALRVAWVVALVLAFATACSSTPPSGARAGAEGSDPALKGQYLLYSAHWDHFGWDPKLPGTKHEQIFHGALDNASGVAALLELARAFRALPVPPRRSILFIATTGEERGLLGAQFYARNPLYPLRDTLADINIDGMNLWGRTHDVQVIGLGNSDLDDALVAAARSQGRVVLADQMPEHGSFYRADQFEFAKEGVPALYSKSGDDYIGKPPGFGTQHKDAYTANMYHKVTDVVQPDWDTAGAVEGIGLLFDVGYGVAQGERFPQWHAGTEFKALRDRMMTGAAAEGRDRRVPRAAGEANRTAAFVPMTYRV